MFSISLKGAASAKRKPSLIVGQTRNDYDGQGDNGSYNTFATQGYSADFITLNNGAVVRVDSTAGQGRVIAFTITQTGPAEVGIELFQVSTTGNGTGFAITPGPNNIE